MIKTVGFYCKECGDWVRTIFTWRLKLLTCHICTDYDQARRILRALS